MQNQYQNTPNRCHNIAEVSDSSSLPPIPAPLQIEDLGLREVLEMLMTPDVKRRLRLRHLTNDSLFPLYDNELLLRLHNAKNLRDTRRMLGLFKEYLNGYPPSPELAKGFLAQYSNKEARTLYRYSQMIKMFMRWYGEPIDDFKVKIPKTLPQYTEDKDIEKLFGAIENKRSHKGCITRDLLLVEVALKTGMRRSELSNLEVQDIHSDFLVVKNGKGGKDRVIPLISSIALRLQNFTLNMLPDEKVFKLKPACISNKIKQFAKKAGVDAIHTHSMRHKFATDLLERGADIRSVQEILGHDNLNTTQVYLSITSKRTREAVSLLDKPKAVVSNSNGGAAIDELVEILEGEKQAITDYLTDDDHDEAIIRHKAYVKEIREKLEAI